MKAVLIRYFGLSNAVVFSLLLKFWQAGASLFGLFLISLFFTPEMQGFYYTFVSLVALQSFAELGLYIVILNLASHEWSKLNIAQNGMLEGDPQALSRLVSLGRFVFKWYAVAALMFFLLAGGGGYWFLSQAQTTGIDWQMPWLLHIAFSSLLLWCMPFLSLLEGCGKIAEIAKFRVKQVVSANVFFFASIVYGANLWAAPILSSISAAFCIYYLIVHQRYFFKQFLKPPVMAGMSWKKEILPMQWRLGLMGLFSYFAFSFITPVMFSYHGSVVAGKMGMSLQLVAAVQSIAAVWIMTVTPKFGVLVANGKFAKLDSVWGEAVFLTIGMTVLGVALFLSGVFAISVINADMANRILPLSLLVLLSVGAIFQSWGSCFALYLRAHKREILTPVGILTSMMMGLMVWHFGSKYGALGASASHFFVFSCVNFPLIYWLWRKARRDWHK